MKNIQNLMKQAQEMQTRMQEMQTKLEGEKVDGTSGGGMVKAVVTGKGIVISVKIDPSLIVPDDKEMLEDLVVAAINDAKVKAQHLMDQQMSQLTGGMGLPAGMKLPF